MKTTQSSCPFETFRAARFLAEIKMHAAQAQREAVSRDILNGTARLIGKDAKGLDLLLGMAR